MGSQVHLGAPSGAQNNKKTPKDTQRFQKDIRNTPQSDLKVDQDVKKPMLEAPRTLYTIPTPSYTYLTTTNQATASATCDTFVCPGNYVLKPNAAAIKCAGATCGGNQVHTCCKATASAMRDAYNMCLAARERERVYTNATEVETCLFLWFGYRCSRFVNLVLQQPTSLVLTAIVLICVLADMYVSR